MFKYLCVCLFFIGFFNLEKVYSKNTDKEEIEDVFENIYTDVNLSFLNSYLEMIKNYAVDFDMNKIESIYTKVLSEMGIKKNDYFDYYLDINPVLQIRKMSLDSFYVYLNKSLLVVAEKNKKRNTSPFLICKNKEDIKNLVDSYKDKNEIVTNLMKIEEDRPLTEAEKKQLEIFKKGYIAENCEKKDINYVRYTGEYFIYKKDMIVKIAAKFSDNKERFYYAYAIDVMNSIDFRDKFDREKKYLGFLSILNFIKSTNDLKILFLSRLIMNMDYYNIIIDDKLKNNLNESVENKNKEIKNVGENDISKKEINDVDKNSKNKGYLTTKQNDYQNINYSSSADIKKM